MLSSVVTLKSPSSSLASNIGSKLSGLSSGFDRNSVESCLNANLACSMDLSSVLDLVNDASCASGETLGKVDSVLSNLSSAKGILESSKGISVSLVADSLLGLDTMNKGDAIQSLNSGMSAAVEMLNSACSASSGAIKNAISGVSNDIPVSCINDDAGGLLSGLLGDLLDFGSSLLNGLLNIPFLGGILDGFFSGLASAASIIYKISSSFLSYISGLLNPFINMIGKMAGKVFKSFQVKSSLNNILDGVEFDSSMGGMFNGDGLLGKIKSSSNLSKNNGGLPGCK